MTGTDPDRGHDDLHELLSEDVLAAVPGRRRVSRPIAGLVVGLVGAAVLAALALRGGETGKTLGAADRTDTTRAAVVVVEPAAANPPSRSHAAMASSPDGVLLTGGQGAAGIHTDTWLLRDPDAPGWEVGGGLTTAPARSAASLEFVDSIGAFLLFGGTSNPASSACPPACVSQMPTDEMRRYDPSEDRWSAVSAVEPEARLGHASAYDPRSDRLIVFGGVGSTGRPGVRAGRLLADTWLYDPVAETWEQLQTPQAPQPRAWHQMVHHPGTGLVYLWGGRTAERDGDPAVWAFDPGAHTWTPLPVRTDDPPARWLHAMTLGPDGLLVVVGGEWFQRRDLSSGTTTIHAATEEVWGWDPGTGAWTRLSDFSIPISGHAAAATGDGRVMVFHGDHTSLYGPEDSWTNVLRGSAEDDH